MIAARLAVYAAVACTLWLNGSYAWHKGGHGAHQYAAVAIALTIDAAKCGLLSAASHLWVHRQRAAALALVVLWPFAFLFSTFSGYASLTTNRTASTATDEGASQRRARAQADYDAATQALIVAKVSPHWHASAACASPKGNPQTTFCTNINRTKSAQAAAAVLLNASKPVHVDPELNALAGMTGLPPASLLLIVAFFPACLLELLSSVGFYAVHRTTAQGLVNVPRTRRWHSWLGWRSSSRTNTPTARPDAAGASFQVGTTPPTPKPAVWRVSAT